MSPNMAEGSERRMQQKLGAAETRRFLRDYVKRRVSDGDIDDVVQTVLVEALASKTVPDGETDLRKWLIGVARHKIADLHRRAGREQPSELPDVETSPGPVEERELIRWVEKQAKGSKDAEKTLDWMAREGEGDKLEHIAEEESLPAATVRQRVSRMRRWMKERWLAELAAVAALGILAFVVWRFVLQPKEIAVPEPENPPVPTARPDSTGPHVAPDRIASGKALRQDALEHECRELAGESCLDKLDRAKDLDPAGDSAPEVEEARKANAPAPPPTAKPVDSAPPPPTATPKAPPPTVKPTATAPWVKPPSTTNIEQKSAPSKPSFGKKSSSIDLDDGAQQARTSFGTGTGTPSDADLKGAKSRAK